MTDFSFTAHNGHLSIPQGFVWEDIPEFAIVTGKNGTGKSQLLKCMEINAHSGLGISPYLMADILYLAAHQVFADPNTNNVKYSDTLEGTKSLTQAIEGKLKEIHTAREVLKKHKIALASFKDYNEWHNLHWGNFWQSYSGDGTLLNAATQHIKNAFGAFQNQRQIFRELSKTLNKAIEDISAEEFRENLPQIINTKFGDASALKKWFSVYLEEYNQQAGKAARDKNKNHFEELGKEFTPWQIMNNILQKYGFKYTIKDFDPNLSPLQIKFTDGKLTVPIESLSSGEQQLIAFVSWAHHDVVSKNIKLLLLDEPDAHLHPSFCRIFIEIIQEYVVKKGIRVIMSTHSPSTVAFAPEDSIFVLNMPETEPRIKKQSKEEALNTLTDGLMHLSEGSLAAINIISSAEKGKKFLLCEGKTDVEHIETAINLFDDLSRVFSNIKIVPVGSASNYEVIIRFLREAKVRQEDFLILVDGDKEGKDAITKMERQHWNRYIELTTKNIDRMTGLFEHSEEFKRWCLEKYPTMINDLDPSIKQLPSGKEQLLSSSFGKYIEAGECSNKIPNPLNRNTLEDADNVFKNLWVEYLKQNTEIAKQCYIPLKDFLIENINFNS